MTEGKKKGRNDSLRHFIEQFRRDCIFLFYFEVFERKAKSKM
jgi:hypothetical protein